MEKEEDVIKKQRDSEEQQHAFLAEAEEISEIKEPNWKKIISLTFLSLFVLGGIAYGGYWYFVKTPSSKLPISESNSSPAPTLPEADETADWEVYTNRKYGFEFKYPHWVILEDRSVKGAAQVVLVAQGFRETLVSAKKAPESNFYLDTAPIGEVKMGNLSGKKYYLPDGYCDGPECTAPILAAVSYKDGIRYVFRVFVLQETNDFTDRERTIISTFRFTEEPCSDCRDLEMLSMDELTQISKDCCEECAGKWELLSKDLDLMGCNPKTSDGGDNCKNNEQCIGYCLAKEETDSVGTCSNYKHRLGCNLELEGGIPVEICRD